VNGDTGCAGCCSNKDEPGLPSFLTVIWLSLVRRETAELLSFHLPWFFLHAHTCVRSGALRPAARKGHERSAREDRPCQWSLLRPSGQSSSGTGQGGAKMGGLLLLSLSQPPMRVRVSTRARSTRERCPMAGSMAGSQRARRRSLAESLGMADETLRRGRRVAPLQDMA
jgi:hypothetical protein